LDARPDAPPAIAEAMMAALATKNSAFNAWYGWFAVGVDIL
jgi:hypothetical protein